jgi:hypothetical protein
VRQFSRHGFVMGFFAPRISNRLRDEIDRLASKPYRAAEI